MVVLIEKRRNSWIEVTFISENKEKECHYFSGEKEHIDSLNLKIKEYKITLTKEQEDLIKEIQANFIYPTDEELLVEANKAKVQEARAYLISTAWYIERLNDPSSGKAIPQEVLDKRAKARVLINELEG